MSETPAQLEQIIEHLTAALLISHNLGYPSVTEDILAATLTAQLRDPVRQRRLMTFITGVDDDAPPARPLGEPLTLIKGGATCLDCGTDSRILGPGGLCIQCTRKLNDQVAPDVVTPRAVSQKFPVAEGTCGHGRPVRHNTAVGYVRHTDGDRSVCDQLWEAAADAATVATPVDAPGDCEHPWHTFWTPDGEPIEPACPACADRAHPAEQPPATADELAVAADTVVARVEELFGPRPRTCCTSTEDVGHDFTCPAMLAAAGVEIAAAAEQPRTHNGDYGVDQGADKGRCTEHGKLLPHYRCDESDRWLDARGLPRGEPLTPCPNCGAIAGTNRACSVCSPTPGQPDGDTRLWFGGDGDPADTTRLQVGEATI